MYICLVHQYRDNKPCPKCEASCPPMPPVKPPKEECFHQRTLWTEDKKRATCIDCGSVWDETSFWHLLPEPTLGETLRQKRLDNGMVMLETADKTMIEYLDAIRKHIEGGEYDTASYLARSLQVHLDKANTLANLLAELDK